MASVVEHPVTKIIDAVEIAASDTSTSVFIPTDSVVEIRVICDADATSPDIDIELHYSDLDQYTLNKLSSVTTEHYWTVTIASGHSATARTRWDADDVAELARPPRSLRAKITNNDGAAAVTVTLVIEGWG